MTSPLETLRAFSQSTRPRHERNETNEITPPMPSDEGLTHQSVI